MMQNSAKFKHELIRKLIHLTSLWIPFLYYISDFYVMLVILLPITLILVVCDFLRHKPTKLGGKIRDLCRAVMLNRILRYHEENGSLSGASYMMISASICLLLFSAPLFITAFTILMLADTMAALIGQAFGKAKIVGNKTWVGTITFFTVSTIIAISLGASGGLDGRHAVFAATVTTLAEMFSEKLKLDDNLLIPFAYGLTYVLVASIIG